MLGAPNSFRRVVGLAVVAVAAGLLVLVFPWDAASSRKFLAIEAVAAGKEAIFVADSGRQQLLAIDFKGQRLWQHPWSGTRETPVPGLVALADGGVLAVTGDNTALRRFDRTGADRGSLLTWDPAEVRPLSFGVSGDSVWFVAVQGRQVSLTRRPLEPGGDPQLRSQVPSETLVLPADFQVGQALPRDSGGFLLVAGNGQLLLPQPRLQPFLPGQFLRQGSGYLLLNRVSQVVYYWQSEDELLPVTVFSRAILEKNGEEPRFPAKLGDGPLGQVP